MLLVVVVQNSNHSPPPPFNFQGTVVLVILALPKLGACTVICCHLIEFCCQLKHYVCVCVSGHLCAVPISDAISKTKMVSCSCMNFPPCIWTTNIYIYIYIYIFFFFFAQFFSCLHFGLIILSLPPPKKKKRKRKLCVCVGGGGVVLDSLFVCQDCVLCPELLNILQRNLVW